MTRQTVVRRRVAANGNRTSDVGAVVAGAELNARVQQLQEQFELLKAQVRQAQQLAALGTAAAMIAHEVNNLLTPLRSFAQTAVESDDRELQRKALTVALRDVDTLTAMSERVLHISAAKPPRRQTVSVREAAENAVATLCRDPAKDGIQLALEVDPSLTVWADPLQLEQVLFNLLLNARNAMAKAHGGRLTVSASGQNERVVVVVRDTGPGISADLLPHVFEPLQTSKPVERNGHQRCAGLGLALCRDLVEENGGTIAVSSSGGQGTTFTIELPADDLEAPGE